MAYTIVVISSKGGVGKSTITCGVTSVLSRFAPRQRILAIDGDSQANTSLYLEGCGEQALPNVDVSEADAQLLAKVAAVDTGHAWRIIDLPGYAESTEISAVLGDHQAHIDLAIVPMGPSQFDLESVTAWTIRALLPLGVPYGVLLSRVPPRAANQAIDLQRQISDAGLSGMQTFIREYRGVQDAQRDRVPLTQFGGRHDTVRYAEDDMRALTAEIARRVGSRIRIPTRAAEAQEARDGR